MKIAHWRKSSYSGGEAGQCVELAELDGAVSVGIRDGKNPEGGHLAVGRADLAVLVCRIKDGALDL
ncbi:DUF397 domain-containing protein [Actinomadura sp. LD22]|uniref:DUF397 domain-containing protein n=2 Tax=Actinomadura physcomitrii TaxID=2650748 RepID=A0A6I4M4Y1_9ACTN|nr:DUF397 domain-containing protein [Actinomadura physcomitrii]